MTKTDQQSTAPRVTDVPSAQSPLELSMAYVTGACWHGVMAKAIRIDLVDGTVQRIQLRSPRRVTGLSARKQRIVDILGESPTPMTRLAVAHKCGLESASGRFGQDMKELIEDDGLVCQKGQEVTDDPAKFSMAG